MKAYKYLSVPSTDTLQQWLQHNLLSPLLITITLLLISYLHYSTAPGISQLHAVYRYFYFLPIVFGALQFGYWGGLFTALAATLIFIPHILLRWDVQTLDAFNDLLVVFVFFGVALITGLTIDRLKHAQIEQAQTAAKLALSLEQLQKQGEALRRSERLSSLGTLAGGLAHEIRNPLGIIRACAQLLELEDDGISTETVTIIRQESDRIEQLVQELLNYAGNTGPQLEQADLCELVRKTGKRLRPLVDAAGIRLLLELPTEMTTVIIDCIQIEKMLINLCMNALQSLNGSGSITLAVRQESESKSLIRLEVTDDGPGISPVELSRIFDPFYSTKDKGVGLGLSVVQRIVDDHNGRIRVETEVGEGTKFIIDIPVHLQQT
jgi:signal transduction histidine kinase